MKTEKIKIDKVKLNPNNPRLIKDDKFHKLVDSIKAFPKMLELRPIVVNEDMIVLGGNMRLKACIEAGLKEVYIIKANDLTEEEQKQFIIKDNIGFGEWDWEMLANEWNEKDLSDWGLEISAITNVDLDSFFEEDNEDEVDGKHKIVLEYTEAEYHMVKDALAKHGKTPEESVYNLLGL